MGKRLGGKDRGGRDMGGKDLVGKIPREKKTGVVKTGVEKTGDKDRGGERPVVKERGEGKDPAPCLHIFIVSVNFTEYVSNIF